MRKTTRSKSPPTERRKSPSPEKEETGQQQHVGMPPLHPPVPVKEENGDAKQAKQFRISTTVKSIDGDNISDLSLSDIIARGATRPDVRDADTPLAKGLKSKKVPKLGFKDKPSQHEGNYPAFNPDSITTPHTYARAMAQGSPRRSPVGQKALTFLRRSWDAPSQTFDFRCNVHAVSEFAGYLIELCNQARNLFLAEPMFLNLPADIFVIGDIHGNFGDLNYFMSQLLLFEDIEITPYSFLALGDYVDRGQYSVECIALCLALKCMSPETFFMLRGNHEDPGINGDMDTYGFDCFQSQCLQLFGSEVGMDIWNAVNSVFKNLPLAASIAGKIFCTHGGIPRYYGGPENDDRMEILKSPDFPRLRSLFEPLDMSVHGKEKMERFWVAAFDCMWSDPSDDDAEMNEYGFGRNDRGSCIITFSEVAVENFLATHGMELMFRAHQEKSDGLKLSKSAKCLTIFSSSNYQGHGNGAGVVYVGSNGVVKLIMKEPE